MSTNVSVLILRITWCLCCISYSTLLISQDFKDSIELNFERLTWKDIKTSSSLLTKTKVISGSRSEKELGDIPFTLYVITGEEIRRKGYLTLVDVLKRLPGIRVSQPGSALEGETFLMRGLQGNAYAKILINDVPVKPFIVNGMPIGAQLPIREAERIEVIYGPSATLYGADASVGVINIILKDSDLPVYVHSDLGFGNDGFENLNILFGGKMGKGNDVVKFKAFGSYTAFDDRRIKYDRDFLYNPNTYQDILQTENFPYLDNPNYAGEDGRPVLGNLPHLSSSMGIDLQYRSLQFSLSRFNRRDHSSLGLSPYAASYANPVNFFGEVIDQAQFVFSKKTDKFRIRAGGGALFYETDGRSSYSYIMPTLNLLLQSESNGTVEADSINAAINDRYFSGSRYSNASSIEVNLELIMGYQLRPNIEIAGGARIQGGRGNPLENFSPVPNESQDNRIIDKLVNIDKTRYADLSTFLEGYFNYDRWNAIVGAQLFTRQTDYLSRQKLVVNPRIAIQYKLSDFYQIRASGGRAFRYPSPFYLANSYTVTDNNRGVISTGATLSPEQTSSAEIGLRLNNGKNFQGDLTAYFSKTSNYISYFINADSTFSNITLGYFNDTDASASIYGVQGSLSFDNIVPSFDLNSRFNFNLSLGNETLNILSFLEGTESLLTLEGIRAQPKWTIQWDLEFTPLKRVQMVLENTFVTSSLTRNVLLFQFPEFQSNNNDIRNDGFYTLDLTMNYRFNKNLYSYIRATNVFNAQYAGIDATQDTDGLLYTPQSGRFIRLGINYRLN